MLHAQESHAAFESGPILSLLFYSIILHVHSLTACGLCHIFFWRHIVAWLRLSRRLPYHSPTYYTYELYLPPLRYSRLFTCLLTARSAARNNNTIPPQHGALPRCLPSPASLTTTAFL